MKKKSRVVLILALILSLTISGIPAMAAAAEGGATKTVNNLAELNTALAAAKDGDVIQLASDITITSEEECVTFAKDADVTLDLNGYTIKKTSFPNNPSYKEQKGCINVSIGALTIKDGDGASDKEGGIIAGVTGYAYAIDVNGSGEVIIADDLNIKFEGGSAGALVKLRNNGKFTLIEGTLDAHSCTTSTSTEVFELYDTGADSAVNIEGGLVLCNQGAGFSWGSKPKWNITGGTFNKNTGIALTAGYELVKHESENLWDVEKIGIKAGDWKGVNGLERYRLYVYNGKLATATNNNPEVYELNSASAANNMMYRTYTDAVVGAPYSFEFDYTNRLGVSKEENSFELYIVPGADNTNINTVGTIKLGTYYGFDDAWTTASGMFNAPSSKMTVVLKPVKSTGLGGIFDLSKFAVSEKPYTLKYPNDTTEDADNSLKNFTFDAKTNWRTTDSWGIETAKAPGPYTASQLNQSNILEINGGKGADSGVVYQQLNNLTGNASIEYSFDFTARGAAADVNTISLYFIPGTDIADYATKGIRIGTVLGITDYWQTTSGTFTLPKNFSGDGLFVFETAASDGTGGIVDNPYVKVTPFSPVVEKVTDKTIEVTAIEGAEYTIKDATGKVIAGPQDSNVFKDLNPGTAYTITVEKGDANKEIKGVTSKKVLTAAEDKPEATKVTERAADSLTIDTVATQEYSIDGGKTWVKGTGNPYTFDGLESGKEYTILTRNVETFDTMPGKNQVETKVSTLVASEDVEKAGQPTLVNRTEKSLTFTCGEDEEMSIDGGKTWVKGPKVTFTGLDEGKEYNVLTRKAATEDAEAGQTTTTVAKTPIKIGGTVTGKDLPAKVVITDPDTNKVIGEVYTDEKGNWTAYLDQGDYHLEFIGKEKEEEAEKDITVSLDGPRDFDAKLTDKDAPETGDMSNFGFFASLLTLAGAALAVLTAKRRREEI